MAQMSLYLFTGGALTLLFAFVAHVTHTAIVANGRRTVSLFVPGRGLAAAGAGAGGGIATLDPVDSPTRGGLGPLDGDRLAGPTSDRVRVSTGAALSASLSAGSAGMSSPVSGIAITSTWVAWALIGLSMLLRAIVVGRGPWGNMYEFSVAFAWGITSGYLFLQRRYPIRALGALPLGVALFLAAYAATLPASIEPLVPALDNAPLLTVHVAMAMISYGIFATSFAAAVGYLIQGTADRYAWLPSHKVLDAVAYRAVIIGFPVFATMIILGSYWASIAWGSYWSWDPKETSALVTWLIYAVYLHARNQRGWAGRPAALILVVGFAAILFTFFGNLYFTGLHAYSGLPTGG